MKCVKRNEEKMYVKNEKMHVKIEKMKRLT